MLNLLNLYFHRTCPLIYFEILEASFSKMDTFSIIANPEALSMYLVKSGKLSLSFTTSILVFDGW